MLRILPVVLALPLVVAYGVAEGLWTDRWSVSPELVQAQERLDRVPLTVGPWQGEEVGLDERTVRQAELRGHILRRYVNRETGEVLTVMAVCGRPGPVAVHSPEVCYGGAGFTPVKARKRHAVEAEGLSGSAELWAERYHKAGAAIPEQLQVYYGWNAGQGWQAVESPRISFAPARALYKLYVVRNLPQLAEPAEKDPIPGFLKQFVPALDRCLFG
jgi:hypothetical protein